MATFTYALGAAAPAECRGGVITLGNFDGVHVGHQALAAEAVRQARGLTAPAVAVTFDPHPTALLRPELFQPLLTTPAYRAELLQGYGPDHVLILQTSPALLQLRAAEFFEQIIRRQLQARAIVEGFNFGFGRNREGTIATLQELGEQAGIPLTLVPPVEIEGLAVSTSRVRRALLTGAVEHARELLGRPYRLAGTVVAGARRGAGLGFPTANLGQVESLIPGDGVYAVRVEHGGRAWPGATNIGPNPTFGDQARKVEVHLIGFQGDLYGSRLTIDFAKKLREPRRFASADDLKRQIDEDVAQAARLGGD
jgi:riboflavin kinase/FMN adenylyltransferase